MTRWDDDDDYRSDRYPVGVGTGSGWGGITFSDVFDILGRYDKRRKPSQELATTQEAVEPRQRVMVALDKTNADGEPSLVPAQNATGFTIGAGVRVRIRYDRPSSCVIEAIAGFNAGMMNAWVPRWEVISGTVPVVGNGELLGTYQVINGRFFFEIGLLGGSTTVWGSTIDWLFTMPTNITPQRPTQADPGNTIANATAEWRAYDSVPGARYGGFCDIDRVTWCIPFIQTSASAFTTGLRSTAPFTWATGDWLLMTGNFPVEAY